MKMPVPPKMVWILAICCITFLVAIPFGMWSQWILGNEARHLMLLSIDRHIWTTTIGLGIVYVLCRPITGFLVGWNAFVVLPWCLGIFTGIALIH